MPIYAYRCDDCGHKLDALQKLSEAPLKDCPQCGKASLSKMVTAAGFQLKGSGWYATDFKSAPKTTAGESGETKPSGDAKGDANKTTGDKAGASASTEAKPAASTESKSGGDSKAAAPSGASAPAAPG